MDPKEAAEKILASKDSTPEMKIMAIVMMLGERLITKVRAFNLLEDHGIFTKNWIEINNDCEDELGWVE